MLRRDFLALAASAPLFRPRELHAQTLGNSKPAPVKLGIDLFSLRSQNWTPFEYLDYCARQKAKVVHFSEVRFIGSLEPDNLRRVRHRAEELGIELEIGMRSICPTSTMFDPKAGTATEQLTRMIDSAHIVGSKIVRAVLGGMDDRKTAPIEKHIENTVTVLKSVRAKAIDSDINIAIENHAGDMQGHELKLLIEEAGRDFVGACLDCGNPLWTLEDPHVTLETLHPYVLTSHVRDSAVWRTPNGAAVTWVRMGEGNVGIDSYVQKFAHLCPGRALSMESIVFGPKLFDYKDPKFWDAYRDIPAWDFEQFVALAERGKPQTEKPWDRPNEADLEREDLEASLAYTRRILALPA
jgi:sugar phosphate isomerase/epimerase